MGNIALVSFWDTKTSHASGFCGKERMVDMNTSTSLFEDDFVELIRKTLGFQEGLQLLCNIIWTNVSSSRGWEGYLSVLGRCHV